MHDILLRNSRVGIQATNSPGSARVSRVGDRVLAIADFRRSFWRDAKSPIRTGISRETRALPGIPRSREFFARKVLPKKSSELINADRSQTNQ